MWKKRIIRIAAAVIPVMLVALVVQAQPSPGFSKSAPLTGTGSSGAPLKIQLCAANQIQKMNAGGTAYECAADGGGGGISDGDKGDITVTASGATWTIDNAVVTLAKMADIATARFIGRTTAGTGAPEALTATQATAMLDTFTSVLKGLVPVPPGGSAYYLTGAGWSLEAGDVSSVTLTGQGVVSGGTCNGGACVPVVGEVVQTIDVAGTYDDYALSTETTVVQCRNGGTTEITSIANGYNGRRLTITNDPGSPDPICRLRDDSAGLGTAANRIRLLYDSTLTIGSQAGAVELVYVGGGVNLWVQVDMFDATVAGSFMTESGNTLGLQNCVGAGEYPSWNGSSWNCTAAPGGGSPTQQDVATTGSITSQTLNTDTTMLAFTGASGATLLGMTAGAAGRCVQIVNSMTASAQISFTNESGTATAVERFNTSLGSNNWKIDNGGGETACYDGTDSRWRFGKDGVFASITTAGAIVVGSNITVSGNVTANGDSTFGNAATDIVTTIGRKKAAGTVPTVSSCGTTPSAATGGLNDWRVTTGTGAPTACTFTFGTTFTNAPICTATVHGNAYAYISASSTTAITLTFSAGITSTVVSVSCTDY